MDGADEPAAADGVTRVVVVDDRPGAGPTAAAVLSRGGFAAVASDDRAAVIDAVRLEGVAVVVVADGTRDRSGPRFVSDLRDHPDVLVRDVSVVALVDDPTGADAALVAGADSVLLRPVEGERLVEAVGDVARLDAAARRARRRHR